MRWGKQQHLVKGLRWDNSSNCLVLCFLPKDKVKPALRQGQKITGLIVRAGLQCMLPIWQERDHARI
jgi:hypothetical protein